MPPCLKALVMVVLNLFWMNLKDVITTLIPKRHRLYLFGDFKDCEVPLFSQFVEYFSNEFFNHRLGFDEHLPPDCCNLWIFFFRQEASVVNTQGYNAIIAVCSEVQQWHRALDLLQK